MTSKRRSLLTRLLVSLVIGGAFAWLATRGGLPLVPTKADLLQVRPWAIPLYLASLTVMHGLRASRFRFLVAPVRRLELGQVLSLNFIGFFAIFALPLRLGELVRPTLGKARHGIPLSAGLGTVAVERVCDGLITSLCVAWALFALERGPVNDPLARLLPTYGYLALLLFSGGLFTLGLFLWQRALAGRLVRTGVGLISPRLGELVAQKVDGIAEGLRAIGNVRLASAFIAESVAYWGMNALGVWWLGLGCGLPGFTLGHAVAVMGILAIGILLPTGPGLFGTFQLVVVSCLRLYLPEEVIAGQGAVFVFLLYLLQSLVMVGAGLMALARAPELGGALWQGVVPSDRRRAPNAGP